MSTLFHPEAFNNQCTAQQLAALEESNTDDYKSAMTTDFYIALITAGFLHPNGIFFLILSKPFPAKLKIWMWLYYFVDYLYLISFLLTQVLHYRDRHVREPRHGCDLLVPASTCIYFRIWQSYRIVFAHWFFNAVLIDVQLAYIFRWYRSRGTSGLLAVILVIGVAYDVYPSIPAELKSSEMLVNCSSHESKSKSVQFENIFLPLLISDAIGLFIHGAWYTYQYFRARNLKVHLNQKDKPYFEDAKHTFKITLPLFLISLGSNLYHDFKSTKISIDDKLSAVGFMSINSTPLCTLLSAVLLLFILHALEEPALYRQIFFGKWIGGLCCKKKSAVVNPTADANAGEQGERMMLRSFTWTGTYTGHM